MTNVRLSVPFQLRLRLEGWIGGFSTYAYGIFTSYLIFVALFGQLYSISNLIQLAAASFINPTSLVALLIEIYVISYFAIPLGMAFRILWEKRRNSRIRETTTAVIAIAALLGLHVTDIAVWASLAVFSVILIWLLWRESQMWGEGRHRPFTFPKALALLYCTFVAILYVAFAPPLDTYTGGASDLIFKFLPGILIPIQLEALLFTLIAAPVLWILADQRKPKTIWFVLVGLAILSVVTLSKSLILEGSVLLAMTGLLYFRYSTETVESYGEALPTEHPTNPLQGGNGNGNGTLGLGNEPLQAVAGALKKLANEAEFFREERTGEILRVQRHEAYTLPLERLVFIDGFQKSIGINHYLISSRTGQGKTTLVKNLVWLYKDYGFLIMDRHDEYEGQILQLDKEFDPEKFDSIMNQLPSSQLSGGSNMLREAQVYNMEQQFERLIKDSLRPKVVEELFSRVYGGGRVILRPGKLPDFIYTRISHTIIEQMLEIGKRMKRTQEARLRMIVINEEAQNSFNVDDNGEERDRNHPLLKVVHEGRKYGIAIINITSNPENIPRTVKDNSILILGSIGTPAIRRLVGEKLGMIYVRYIYELPVGDFFLDLVDNEGNYIVFPDHFGRRELIDVIKT